MHQTMPAMRRAALLSALALALLLPVFFRPALAAQQYQNSAPIIFNGTGASGPASLYPSPITVSGLEGSITKVTVTLNGFTNSFPDNVDILLVGPDGRQSLLMSDAGGNTAASGLTLTFDDDAATALPNSTALSSGTFRPSNYGGGDSFPSPAPETLSGNTALSIFNLANPNGEWRLFALEDDSGSDGQIAGWSINIATADLAVELSSAPATVNAGSSLTYEATVRNRGTEAVANPTLTLGIPAGTSFSSATPPVDWSCTPPAQGADSFTCATTSLASGAAPVVGVSVLVDQALAPDTTLTRTAAISSAVAEANTENNSASATTLITTLADLEVLTITSAASVNAGAELEIAATVRNNGPSNAANARVTLPVPANTGFVAIAPSDGWSCTSPAPGAAGDVVCSRPVFSTAAAGFILRVKVDPALPAGSTIAGSAAIASDTTDTTPGNNSGGSSTAVTTTTDLAVAVSAAPNPVSAAANLAYSIVLTNNGPSNAADAVLTTEVRSGTTFVSLEAPAGWNCTTPPVGDIGAVSCANPSFGVGSTTFTLTVRVLSGTPAGAQLSLAAAATASTTDSNLGNNSVTTSTDVTVVADLGVRVDGVGQTTTAGATLGYNLRVNNSGPEQAEGVTLTAATPSNTTFVSLVAPLGWSCTAPAVGATGPISCTNAGLDVTTETLVLTVKVDAVPYGTPVAFSAALQSPTEDGDQSNNNATLNSVTVAPFRSFLPMVRR
jgi:uncharacterized repeat protein (TIGR01451 family)